MGPVKVNPETLTWRWVVVLEILTLEGARCVELDIDDNLYYGDRGMGLLMLVVVSFF